MATTIAKIEVRCPECGHGQLESENFISTVCRSCSAYFKSSFAAQIKKKKGNRVAIRKRELTCADCGAVQMVAEEAQSSTCLECGRHLELGHRLLEGEHLGNLSLEGELRIGPKGNFGGSKARAARIILEGRATGLLEAAEWLRVEGQAKLRAGAKGSHLTIPEGARLEAADELSFGSGEIEGELQGEILVIAGMLRVGPKGKVRAEKIVVGELVVEAGGRLSGYGEVKTKAVTTEEVPPERDAVSEVSK